MSSSASPQSPEKQNLLDAKSAGDGTAALSNKKTLLLILIAVFALLSIGGLTMYERAHDPDWWKHVGIRHERPNSNNNKNDKNSQNTASDSSGVVLLDDGTMFVVPKKSNSRNHPADSSLAPLNGRGYAENKRLIDFNLKNGTDFFADYDVNVGDPKPEPGIEIKNPYIDITSPNARWTGKWLSHHPFVAAIPEFLTDRECDQLIAEASKVLFRSQVAPYKNSNQEAINEVRTSSQAWLNPNYGIAKTAVDRVMQLLTTFPQNAHEDLQILKYEKGQKYDAHADYFDPALYGPQATNRAVTVFLYLSDVEEGGETGFPRAGGRPPPMEFKSCNKGLRVRPKKRSIAVFYDMDCHGRLDPTSLHGGCPVIKGVKWGGTLWIRR